MSPPVPAALLALLATAAPGSLLWEVNPGCRDLVGMAEAAGVVVAANDNGDGGLLAYSAETGKRLWAKRGTQVREGPATDGRRFYAVLGNQGPRRLVAFDPRTGKELWSVSGDNKLGGPSGPVTDGARVYLLNADGTLAAFDAATGKKVWQISWGDDDPECPTGLVVRDGLLAFGGGRHWMGPSKGRPKALWAVDAATGRERWRYTFQLYPKDEGGECHTTPVIADGSVVSTTQQFVFAVSADTGTLRWKAPMEKMSGGYPKARPLSRAAVSKGVVFASFQEGLASWSLATGSPLPEMPGVIGSDPQVVWLQELDGVLYFVGRLDGEDDQFGKFALHAMDVGTRRIRWRHRTSRPVKYLENWETHHVLPTASGVYYENASILANVAR